jgi:phosphoglycerol transferase MdoB-like AlkP superfamily enzyme
MKTYLKQNINLFKVFVLGLLIFGVFRFIYLIRFGETGIFSNFSSDVVAAFLTGIRFDAQILCYVFALIFLLNFFLFTNNEKLRKGIIMFSKYYALVLLLFLSLLNIIDHQFYTYFQSHLNILAYGFIDDDTSAVFASIWSDHPVIIVFFSLITLTFVLYKIVYRIYASNTSIRQQFHPAINVGLIFSFIALFGLGLRGAVGVFPLKIDDAVISENNFINGLTLNGVYTLEKAIEERSKQSKPIYQADVMKSSGYNSIKEILGDYYGKSVADFPSDNYLDYLFETTDTNTFLAQNPPNVIFVLMESFGGYYLNFHSKELNLLGSLEEHFQKDILFSNFLSSTQGTIYSLEHIIINKNNPIVSGTSKRFEKYSSSVAYPYFNAGYQTTFISGGNIAWRNLHEFLPKQYFKTVYGKTKIMKDNPQAKANTWGVYDEYLWQDIFNQLQSAPKTPKLIFGLTTTNHTPYEIPENYQPYPINISDSLNNIILANKDIAQLNFTAYQYANDCLGKFLTKLKASEYGKNTIVAVSGDHNSYALFPHLNTSIQKKDNHIVPFYLYIPEAYKKDLHINKDRYGSHKDIFPTLINISLANQKYFSLGNNLFDVNKPDSMFYGINENFEFAHPNMSKETLQKREVTRRTLNQYYFANP